MALRILIASLFLVSAVFATNSVDFGVGAGYRHDNLHWSLYDDQGFNALDMKYEGLKSAEIDGYIKGIYKYVYLYAYADYAWICSGKNKTAFLFDPNLNPNQIPPLGVGGAFGFTIPLNGWLTDEEARGGFAIPCWERGARHVFLVPFAGFSYHRQFIRYGTPQPQSALITQIPSGLPFSSASLTPNLSCFSSSWWGPMFGLNLDLRPIDSLELEMGYSCLFLAHTQKQRLSGVVMLDFGGIPVPEMILMQTKSKFQPLQANQVRGKIAYHVFPFWKLGLSGSFLNVNTPTKRKMDIFENIEIPAFGLLFSFTNVLRTKTNWTMYDILFESGFTF